MDPTGPRDGIPAPASDDEPQPLLARSLCVEVRRLARERGLLGGLVCPHHVHQAQVPGGNMFEGKIQFLNSVKTDSKG